MKTPEEIKKGLKTHANFGICMIDCPYDSPANCEYSCTNEFAKDALAYIQQLEATYSQVSKALCGKGNATPDEVLQAASQLKNRLQAYEESAIKCCYESRCNKEINALNEYCDRVDKELEAVKRERDAAVRDIKFCAIYSDSTCELCKNGKNGRCQRVCLVQKEFEWRGVCPENTEAD
jgi:hypothetical protein